LVIRETTFDGPDSGFDCSSRILATLSVDCTTSTPLRDVNLATVEAQSTSLVTLSQTRGTTLLSWTSLASGCCKVCEVVIGGASSFYQYSLSLWTCDLERLAVSSGTDLEVGQAEAVLSGCSATQVCGHLFNLLLA